MARITRESGISVETNGSVAVVSGEAVSAVAAARGGTAMPPVSTRANARRARRAGGRVVVPGTLPDGSLEADWLKRAFEGDRFTVVDAIPLQHEGAAPPRLESVRRSRRRGAVGSAATGALVGVVDLGVPLEPDEHTVVLLEQDGVYSWHLPAAFDESAAEGAHVQKRKAGKRRRAVGKKSPDAGSRRTAHFRLDVAPGVRAGPGRAARAGRAGRRRGILGAIVGKAVAIVLRFVAKPALKGVAKWLERDFKEGLVRITNADPTSWKVTDDTAVKLPKGRAAKVLLFVHGTFSSTVGSFGALAATAEGKAFLKAAFDHYDLIIGWDHRTLSRTPVENAQAVLEWLQAQAWGETPVLDAISFSRGGLVFRSLVEELLPSATRPIEIRRAVFVGCTNGGTELARPENWHRFADTYINLAAAGARAVGVIPGFAAAGHILSAAIQGVGSLLKALATAAVTDEALPGLAAMNPGGPFVKQINLKQPGQPTPDEVQYFAVTSDFDPDTAADDGNPNELPPGLLLKLADKGADALYGKPNDLVVHVAAMTQIDPDVGTYVRQRYDYGVNGTVHHCRYFAEPETATVVRGWLVD